jgi:hypothetical protein
MPIHDGPWSHTENRAHLGKIGTVVVHRNFGDRLCDLRVMLWNLFCHAGQFANPHHQVRGCVELQKDRYRGRDLIDKP